jgi:hypothetical protein
MSIRGRVHRYDLGNGPKPSLIVLKTTAEIVGVPVVIVWKTTTMA